MEEPMSVDNESYESIVSSDEDELKRSLNAREEEETAGDVAAAAELPKVSNALFVE